MKTIVKILILFFSLSLTVLSVMIFEKTKVEPPLATETFDQYSKCLDESLSLFSRVDSKVETPEQEDSLFFAVEKKIRFFADQNKVDAMTGNRYLSELCSRYAPLFIKRSMAKFYDSEWYASDHKYMLDKSDYLESLRNFSDAQVVDQEIVASLNKIKSIIDDYREARAISRKTYFTNINDARSTIKKANEYAKDHYLSHCTSLVNSLGWVQSFIGASHYDYVCAAVNKLAEYKSYKQDYYDNTLVPEIQAIIEVYDNNAETLYGTKRDVNVLWEQARAYYREGLNYYESLLDKKYSNY